MKILHDHIENILHNVREPWDSQWGSIWLHNDLDVIKRIATGENGGPSTDGISTVRQPIGWPEPVRRAVSMLGKLAPELEKLWRWRPGMDELGTQQLIVGTPVIDVLEWSIRVIADAIGDAARDDSEADRDAFIHHRRLEGLARKRILMLVNEMAEAKGWKPLESLQAISQADRRYRSRTGKTRLSDE